VYAQGEWKLFLAQTGAIQNGCKQLDLGDDVRRDRVGSSSGCNPPALRDTE